MSRSRALRTAALLLSFCAGCTTAPPVRVEPLPAEEVRVQLERSALTGDEPSATTSWVLRLIESEELFEKDPAVVLRALHDIEVQHPSRTVEFALAELSYLAGRRNGDRDFFLAAVAYAYEFLLGTEAGEPPSAWDRRFRWACDIYNSALARAFHDPKERKFRLEGGHRELPTGALDVEVDAAAFPFLPASGVQGLELRLADELQVVGLTVRVRDSGLGTPLVAVFARRAEGTSDAVAGQRTSVAATAFLRLMGGVRELGSGLRARLELVSTYDAASVDVAGTAVPLEADLSTALAYGTQNADLWRFDLLGLFKSREVTTENGLILPRPFAPGRIPVVLVHGTASNPSYWAELLNSLTADPELRGHYQFWLFLYASGNPIAFSAASLREELAAMVERHDPDGKDPALRRMVIIGHSQGGLLAKLTGVTLRADDLSRGIFGLPLAELELGPDEAALVRRLFDLEPLPCVESLIFIATPHHGSFLSDRWFSRMFAKLISLPSDLLETSERFFKDVPAERLPKGMQPRIATSLDNMRTDNPLLQILAGTPVDPRIHCHSIIAIGDAAETPAGCADADDGVVAYASAHIDGVESEVLVPSGHSCQGHSRTIVEVRRILREAIGLETPEIRRPEVPEPEAADPP